MLIFTITECPSGVPSPSSPPYTMMYVTGSCSPGAALVAVPVVLSPLGTYGVIDPQSPIGTVYAQRDQFEALCANLMTIRQRDVLMMIYFMIGEGGQLLVERITSEVVEECEGGSLARLESKVDALTARSVHLERVITEELPGTKAALKALGEKVEQLIKRLPTPPHHLDEQGRE